MEIRPLAGVDFGTLYEAFSRAFAEYEVQLDEEQLRNMLTRRGFDPALSFAAFDGDEIAAFTLNGTGDHGGIRTAYDTGTGTRKEHRGRGLATAIFEYSIPYLKQAGVGQYLLEVLQHNAQAVSVYRKLGFETVREFGYSMQKNEQLDLGCTAPGIVCAIERLDVGEFEPVAAFRDFGPSWQNSDEAIKRAAGSLIGLGAYADERLVGYCISEPATGDITQIAVDRPYRRKGIASALLREILGTNENDSVKVINTEIPCPSLDGFLQAKNILPAGRQFEMVKKL